MERINIWGTQIPGNSSMAKTEVMELKKGIHLNKTLATIQWILCLKNEGYKDRKKIVDTYTDDWVRTTDPDYQETFEDVPYLLPYIAPQSKKAVIVVPGGGYCSKAMEGEGTEIAQELQKNGISAFVLWYRTNPYYQPYPLMDLQRAIRYVRYHAAEYGYDKHQISAIGFSAGGAQIGLFTNVLRHNRSLIPAYATDEIDEVDDALDAIAMVYPALNYRKNEAMMFASFPAEEVRNQSRREELIETYDVLHHMNTAGIPHFLSYGTKDDLISIPAILEYRDNLKKTHTPYAEVPVEGAGHGYGAAIGGEYGYWLPEYIAWLTQQ